MKKKTASTSILLISVIFCACQSYFDYKPLERLEGKKFRVLNFSVQNRETSNIENIDLGIESSLTFSDCNSRKDVPCTGRAFL